MRNYQQKQRYFAHVQQNLVLIQIHMSIQRAIEYEKEIEPEQIPFTAEQLAELVELIDAGTISSSIGKKVIPNCN